MIVSTTAFAYNNITSIIWSKMNQENEYSHPTPTLPEGKTFQDLGAAHDTGNEEELYPTNVVQADNAKSYIGELSDVSEPEELDEFKTRLPQDNNLEEGPKPEDSMHPDNILPNETFPQISEFEVRTGNNTLVLESLKRRMENFEQQFNKQQQQFERYAEKILQTDNFQQISSHLESTERLISSNYLRPEHYQELKRIAEEHISNIQDNTAEKVAAQIMMAPSQDELLRWEKRINKHVELGILRPDHLLQLEIAITARSAEITEGVQPS